MSDDTDAQVLQVLRRQARKNRLVNLVVSECPFVSFEAKVPQPNQDVHGGAPPLAG